MFWFSEFEMIEKIQLELKVQDIFFQSPAQAKVLVRKQQY